MPLKIYKDGGGNPIQFMEINGIRYPYVEGVDQDHVVQVAKEAKARDDDILLVTYAKSGTHWTWEIISMLCNGNAETVPTIKQMNMIEAISSDDLTSLASPRVLNTHFRFNDLPKDMVRKKTKIVLVHRNPKDVAVSHFHHHLKLKSLYNYNGTWSEWLPLFLEGNVDVNSWFDYVRDWEKAMEEHPDYPIHLMYYEDMKEDLCREVTKLAGFLELPVSAELCQNIAKKCQFENMQKDKKGLENEFWTNVWVNKQPNFYRKGVVGDWKNYFTVAQNEQFDELYKQKMAGSKLNFRFEL